MLLSAYLETADKLPDRVAAADFMRELTFAQLTRLAVVMRRVCRRETRCDKVGIVLPASAAFAGCLLGGWWAEKIVVPLNFLLQPNELAGVVKDAGLDLIVTSNHFTEQLSPLGVRLLTLETLGLKRRFVMTYLLPTPAVPQAQPGQTAVILYTSGTAGRPKGVELTFRNLHSNIRACIDHAQITPDHSLLGVLPPFHVFGLTAATLLPLLLGVSSYYIPRFQPALAVKTIRERRISIFMAIPSMYAAMIRVKDVQPDAFASLYMGISGGEPLPTALGQAYQDRFGVRLYQGYGLTETSPVLTLETPALCRPGSVGRAIPGTQVLVRDDSGGKLDPGSEGEIVVRGPGIMKGYYRQADETAAAIDGEGWFATGDIGKLDDDGFLSITGRKKEMMIIGGENVFPREIEQVLETHPSVAEAAVVGVSDNSRGEVAVAFVILKKETQATDAELRAFAKERLANFKVPRRVHICEELPRSPTGKILRRALKEKLDRKT